MRNIYLSTLNFYRITLSCSEVRNACWNVKNNERLIESHLKGWARGARMEGIGRQTEWKKEDSWSSLLCAAGIARASLARMSLKFVRSENNRPWASVQFTGAAAALRSSPPWKWRDSLRNPTTTTIVHPWISFEKPPPLARLPPSSPATVGSSLSCQGQSYSVSDKRGSGT